MKNAIIGFMSGASITLVLMFAYDVWKLNARIDAAAVRLQSIRSSIHWKGSSHMKNRVRTNREIDRDGLPSVIQGHIAEFRVFKGDSHAEIICRMEQLLEAVTEYPMCACSPTEIKGWVVMFYSLCDDLCRLDPGA